MLRPLLARLSTETAAFFAFRLLRRQLICFWMHSDVHFCFLSLSFSLSSASPSSLSPVTAFSFSHFCFSRRCLAIQSFTSPSCRRCRLLSRFVVRRRPLIRSLQLVVAIVGLPLIFTSASNSQCQLIVVLRVPQESYKSSYRPVR